MTFRRSLLALLAGATLVIPAVAQAATRPASGAFVEGPVANYTERQSGQNFIVEFTRPVTLTGTYDGTAQATERIVIHRDGSTNVHITLAFTGTACGQPATLQFLIEGQGQLNEDLETGTISGVYAVIDSARQPRGNGIIDGEAGVGGIYEGHATC